MDDAVTMRRVERGGDLDRNAWSPGREAPATGQPLSERLALETRHDRKYVPSCSPTSYSAQMFGWSSAEIGFRLALEALAAIGVGRRCPTGP